MVDQPDPTILTLFGMKLQPLVGGLAGGVLKFLVNRSPDPWVNVATVFAGIVVAGYFGDPVAIYFGMERFMGGVGFVLGFTAMVLLNRVSALAGSFDWTKMFGGRNGTP